jgi:hypothetical protein
MLKLILTSQTLVVKGLCQRPIRIPIIFWLSFSIKYHSIWIKKLMEKVNLIFLVLSLCTRVVTYHLIIFSLALMNTSSSHGHPKPTIKIKLKVNVFLWKNKKGGLSNISTFQLPWFIWPQFHKVFLTHIFAKLMIFLLLQRLRFYMKLLTFKGEGNKLNWSSLWCKVWYLKEMFFV